MKEKVEFKKIREFGEIIEDTFLFLRQNFKPLMKAFLYICGIFFVASIISSVFTQIQTSELRDGYQYGTISNDWRGSYYNFGLTFLFFAVMIMLTYAAMFVTVLSYIALYVEKGNVAPTVPEVWAYFKYYFFRILGSNIAVAIFTIVCFICCIFPGFYVFPAMSLLPVVMIIENGSFSYSFGRSFKLLNNEWWITAATFLVIYVIFYFCSFIVQLPATVLNMASVLTHSEKTVSNTFAFIIAISQGLSHVFMLIPITAAVLIYFNLAERKESTGLLNRIEELGQKPNQDPHTPEEY